jgi:pimeloyl-ACP methyl ester carboxylesterase
MRWLAGGLAVAAIATGCTSGHKTPEHVRVTVTPAQAQLDAPVDIRVSGLQPGERATLTASAVDDFRVTWSSRTTFVASSAGVVDTRQRPVSGSYDDVDPMGVIDRMKPIRNGEDKAVFISPRDGYRVTITVSVDRHQVVQTTTYRSAAFKDRRRSYRLSASGIDAELYEPDHVVGRKPAVLLFGGSGGGLSEYFEAQLLAAHGYPAMALAYFGVPGLPSHLDRIPLDYFVKALRVLRRVHGVDPHRVLTWGVSRGSEAALLLAAHFPRLVYGAVAAVPSSVVNPSYPDTSHSAWTLHGRPLPYVRGLHLGNPSPPERRTIIPVERIRGPIVLICGGSDAVWPSCPYSDAIVKRLSAYGDRSKATELRYPTAGHAVGEVLPYVPTASAELGPGAPRMGGTLAGVVLGRIDAWRHILNLLASLR